MFERRERVFASGPSSNHFSGTAHGGSDGHKVTGQQAGGSGVAPISTAQSANIAAATQPRTQTEPARPQRFNLNKTHTYWWIEYTCERGHFRFKRQRKRKHAQNQPNPQLIQYKCGKCEWIINVFASDNEYYTETDPAANVDFDQGKTHSGDCAYAEPAPQDDKQHPQAVPNADAERDVAEVQVHGMAPHGTRNNGGAVAKRDNMTVAHWVQRARIYEESTTTTTRTYFRTKEDYLDIKKAQNGGTQ
ncbi:hypothetical protein AAVH_00655 [Aphelenchoides avenae]|nr:hypothetical protein AAVH_00655 [Aphelenchus avenae]